MPNVYPELIPFVKEENFKNLKVPVFFVGGGLWSRVYSDKMSESTKHFFNLGTNKEVPLGCRDIYTYRYLKQQGFENVLLTGCVAWYDFDYIGHIKINSHHSGDIKKICVSEPADERNVELLREILIYLRTQFKDADITLVNHREMKDNVQAMKNELADKYSIGFIDISNSVEGFSVYDDCDLHVGFRVHAHIYNLSRRNYTILVSEDIRGAGVNQTLGLENIGIEEVRRTYKPIFKQYGIYRDNETFAAANSIEKRLSDYMDYTTMVGYKNYTDAFERMRYYFEKMREHFERINSVVC